MIANVRRIAILALILAGLAGALVLTPIWIPRHGDPVAKPAIWIPMPKSGMDARQSAIRELLSYNTTFRSDTTLAIRCGSESSGIEPSEEYSIAIGDNSLSPNGQQWKVNLIPTGNDIEVTIHVESSYPPPPPPEPGKPTSPSPKIQNRIVHDHVPRRDLQPIHDALANPDLWLGPQGIEPFGCHDGRAVMIEACVHGQYVARLRNCDAASGEPAQKLWDMLKQRFPQPAARAP